MLKKLVLTFFLLPSQTLAENVDCFIDDSFEGLSNLVKKVTAAQGEFRELYASPRVAYRITEWRPDIQRPPTLLIKVETPPQTFVSTGSIRQQASLLIIDETTQKRRSIVCRPPKQRL